MNRAIWRFTGTYQFNEKIRAGFEFNPAAQEIGFIGNYMILADSESTPMLNLGTSSDRIGTPAGTQAYFLTIGESLSESNVGAYMSINYSEFEKGINFPFGVSYQFSPQYSAIFMNDGRKSHLLFTYSQSNWSVSALWVWFKHPGISFSVGF